MPKKYATKTTQFLSTVCGFDIVLISEVDLILIKNVIIDLFHMLPEHNLSIALKP